jgi:hypothetical protein
MRNLKALPCLVMLVMLAGTATDAAAQSSPRFPTVLWASCDGAASAARTVSEPISLHEVAVRARPMLWFSRDEPLMAVSGPMPREWPRRPGGNAIPEDLVYYRITKLKSASRGDELARAFQERIPVGAKGLVTSARANPETIADVPLDLALLGEMKEFVIRYLFYYPNELGAHSHMHDLESIELRVVVEDADERGDPRPERKPCRQIRVATFYGAAHGLGLYTNVLDLDIVLRDRLDETAAVAESTSRRRRANEPPPVTAGGQTMVERLVQSDPFWPLVVLVEEGKHASAPDRNGDGIFTPNYDVNRFVADAWGVRDTMRSRQLSPVFRADTFKKRVPEIVVDDSGVLREAQPHDPWAVQAFRRYVRYSYELRRPTQDTEICGDPLRDVRDRDESMKRYAADLTAQVHQGNANGLLAGKAFCDDTTMQSSVTPIDRLGRLSFGGAYNGFTHWWERVSGSVRFDGGSGWAATIPVGIQVPGLGGWVVGRLAGPWPGTASRKSADVAYMPSASRFADWYIASGIDYGYFQSSEKVETGTRFAVETGVKFRFPMPNWGTFFGGRIGLRANGQKSLGTARIVFEIGAGIW